MNPSLMMQISEKSSEVGTEFVAGGLRMIMALDSQSIHMVPSGWHSNKIRGSSTRIGVDLPLVILGMSL